MKKRNLKESYMKNIQMKVLSIILMCTLLLICFSAIVNAAINNYAYSFSIDQTSNSAVYANSSYNACGFTAYRYNNPSQAIFGSMLNINPRVLFIGSHGSSFNVTLGIVALANATGSNYYSGIILVYNLNNYNWTNSTLVILGACNTATGNNSIAQAINTKAGGVNSANVTIGWQANIGDVDMILFTKRLNQRLAGGYTVSQSITYAKDFYDYVDNAGIKTVRCFGNTSLIIKPVIIKSMGTSNMMLDDDLIDYRIQYTPKEVITYNSENDMNKIKSTIQGEYGNIDWKNYDITVSEGQEEGDITIDFNLKLGDFYTNSGFCVVIENNQVKEIYSDNSVKKSNIQTQDNQLSQIKLKDKTKDIEKYKKQSDEKLLKMYEGSKNTKQESKLYFDCKTGKKYIIITTTNEINEAIACFVDFYEI